MICASAIVSPVLLTADGLTPTFKLTAEGGAPQRADEQLTFFVRLRKGR